MAYCFTNKSSLYFNTKLYNGNSNTNAITGVGHQPDKVWIKQRNAAINHYAFDAVRGATKGISQNITNGESTRDSTWFNSFDSDGFTVGSEDNINDTGDTYVAWCWKAGGGAGSSNTAGTINTTSTSVNTSAGFSISTYTGNSTSGATVGHGLGKVPACVWIKRLDNNDGLVVYHQSMGNTKHMKTDRTNAEATGSAYWNDTSPDDQVVTLGNDTGVNTNTYVMYAWAEIDGYSRFGQYTGNGHADGTFVYTGFKPEFVLHKRSDSAADWVVMDSGRDVDNVVQDTLYPNLNNAESDYDRMDLLSKGFKFRNTSSTSNASGGTFIYMAFGQTMVCTDDTPATAR